MVAEHIMIGLNCCPNHWQALEGDLDAGTGDACVDIAVTAAADGVVANSVDVLRDVGESGVPVLQ